MYREPTVPGPTRWRSIFIISFIIYLISTSRSEILWWMLIAFVTIFLIIPTIWEYTKRVFNF